MPYHILVINGTVKTEGRFSLKASADVLISNYDNLVYCNLEEDKKNWMHCNLASILHIFVQSNSIQITALSDENYRKSELEMKS